MSQYHNIPNELRQLRQWVCAGTDKIPLNPRTGRKADPTDPETWGSFEEACRAGKRHIGFVLSAGDPYSCIDLDDPTERKKDVPDPDPENVRRKTERHQQILEAAESYAEISQSGNGVHIFVRGKIPRGVRRDQVEVYSAERYIICTGNVLNSLPIDENQPLLDVLFREMDAIQGQSALAEEPETMPDADVLAMAREAENGRKFQLLFDGGWDSDELAYLWPSQSEADFALMAMLCFYSPSNEQCRRLFRESCLGQRKKAHRNKYLDYMIAKCRAKEPPPVDLEAIRNYEETNQHDGGDAASDTRRDETTAAGGLANKDAADVRNANAGVARRRSKPLPPGAIAVSVGESGDGGGDSTGHAAAPGNCAGIENPPGLVGRLADYFYSAAIRPVPEIALASALALTAGICGRSYNVSGTGLNQYLVLLARTGTGKEGISTAINTVVSALRPTIPMADRFIGPSVFASGQGLLRVLDERPCFVSLLGEVGHTFQQLSDPRINDAQRMLKKVLLDLYNKSGFNNIMHPSAYSDNTKNTKMVHAPCVTIMGESTPEVFFGGLDAAQVLDGLLPRFSVIEYTGPRPGRNRNAFAPPPDELLNELGALVTLALATQQNTTCQPVSIDSTAQAMLDELDDYATRMINESGEVERHLWNRAHLKALKLSALLAVGIDPQNPVVGAESAGWARDFVFRDVQLLAGRFASGDVGEGQSKQEIDLKTAIRAYIDLPPDTRRSYRVPEKLVNEKNVVPYHFLRRRLRLVSSFKNDRRGLGLALDSMLAELVREQSLTLIDRKTAVETYGVTQPLYARGITF